MLPIFLYTALTVLIFFSSLILSRKFKNPLLNPLLISILGIICLIHFGAVPYKPYRSGTQIISFFLGPATVVLAIPMYRQLELLKSHWAPILIGVFVSVLTSFASILCLAKIFMLNEALLRSLMPKSITTPIGISLSEQLGGIPPITVVSIIITGILGAIISPLIIKLFHIEHPIAKGIGIGASSHVVGTTKAIELGEVEGAMSSLAIALTGVLTFLIVPLLIQGAQWLHFL